MGRLLGTQLSTKGPQAAHAQVGEAVTGGVNETPVKLLGSFNTTEPRPLSSRRQGAAAYRPSPPSCGVALRWPPLQWVLLGLSSEGQMLGVDIAGKSSMIQWISQVLGSQVPDLQCDPCLKFFSGEADLKLEGRQMALPQTISFLRKAELEHVQVMSELRTLEADYTETSKKFSELTKETVFYQ
ncbi:hypothetical protein ACRRTK_019744 [Alexandromys fortis]